MVAHLLHSVQFKTTPTWQWGLVDEGAQVSMISTGLAKYLDLDQDNFSNILPADVQLNRVVS